ncbi:hypothetical protein E2320_014983 [Naja naja]|nr:hypothetical protein E2320_014983 [Naja naja]
MGSLNITLNQAQKCHPKTGFCYCKPGVAGPKCDWCLLGYWGFGENGCQPCACARDCNKHTGECLHSYDNSAFLNIPIGGRIPDFLQTSANESENEWQWNDRKQGFSALRYPVLRAKVLSAHDKGTHAEVIVKIKKVLKSGKVKITRNNRSIYPDSWTNRGCTCPILNPGIDYLIAGQEDARTNRLLVNMNSLVKPWKAHWGKFVADILRTGCK